MLLALIVLFILLAVIVIDNMIEKSILYPPFIFNTIWFLVILIYVIFKIFDPGEMNILHSNTLIFIVLTNIIFSFGGIYVMYNLKKKPEEISFRPTKIPGIISDIIFIVTIISLILLVFKARELASEIEAKNFFIALRYQLTNKRLDYGILDYFLSFGLFASLYRLYTFSDFSELKIKEKFELIISVLLSFAFLVLSTGRTYFFFYFITVLMTIYLKGKIRRKYLWSFFLAAFITFIIVGIVLNKGGNLEYSFAENFKSSLNHIVAYIEGPVLALDRFTNSGFTHTYGENTFRLFIALLYKLNITHTPPIDIVNEWIFVPYPTNVFTVFYQYIMDFGMIGCSVIFFLFGLIHTWMFYRSKKSGNHFKMLTAYSYYPLFMVFFQDQYFSLSSFWIQLWLYSLIILYFSGNKTHIRDNVS
jgi:oligosaccharide repeat unit polymerase